MATIGQSRSNQPITMDLRSNAVLRRFMGNFSEGKVRYIPMEICI